jgi:hypothetical protein
MGRILLITGATLAGFAYLLNERNIVDPEPIIWLLPAACAICVAVLWE